MTGTICIMAIADQFNREKGIFEQALDIVPTDERLRFLTSACGKDAALLARVQALLRADESGESFLSEQPKATAGPLTDNTFFRAFEQFIGPRAYKGTSQADMTS